MRDISFRLAMASALLALTAPIASLEAHHSHASLDLKKQVELEGVVKSYQWRSPHVYITITVQTAQGPVDYAIESLNPPALAALGWGPDTLKPGEKVRWGGAHDRDPKRPYTGLDWLEKADGKRLIASIAASRAKGEAVQKKARNPASTIGEGLWYRITADGSPHPPMRKPPEGWPLTESAQQRLAAFTEDDNPIAKCIEGGPPRSITSMLGFEWSRPDARTIKIDRDLWSQPRIIHLAPTDAKPGAPSSNGFSVGHFENDQLIVETDNFTPEVWGNAIGIDSTAGKKITERYWLSDDGFRLNVEVTVSDPGILKQPYKFTHQWGKIQDRPLVKASCSLENAQAYLQAGYANSAGATDGEATDDAQAAEVADNGGADNSLIIDLVIATLFLLGAIFWIRRRNRPGKDD